MSSKNFDKMKIMFEGLPVEERWAFMDFTKATLESKVYGRSFLLESKEDNGIECPHCRNIEPKMIAKYGVRGGVQRYRCKACSKMFSSTTGTFLSWTKKSIYAWNIFVKSMMEGHSVRKAAALCEIHRNTAFMWRHKLLDALTQYHNNQRRLKGIVEADDTLFPLSYKGSQPPDRDAHKRGTSASKPGTSKEKVCVSCAVDRNGRTYSKVSALGRTTAKALKRVFRNRISKRAVVCTDNDRAFAKFAAKRKVNKFEHVPLNGPTDRKGPYYIQNVNNYHMRLKQFMRRFKGVATKYLNNYLVWNNIIQNGGRNRITLLRLAIKALVFDRWADITDRPAVPVGV